MKVLQVSENCVASQILEGKGKTGIGANFRTIFGFRFWTISIAYWQDTSKREGAQSVNQLGSHKVIQNPPLSHPNRVKNT